jgi:hypothetical protein
MKMSPWLVLGVGFGVAAFAFRKKSSCRHRSGEEHYNEHDATLLGLKAHQHDVGGPNSSHLKEGIGREVVHPATPQ